MPGLAAHLLKDVWPVTRVATVTARQYSRQYGRQYSRQYSMLAHPAVAVWQVRQANIHPYAVNVS
jgi:hypothetical protein